MSNHFAHHLMHAARLQANSERAKGNTKGANATMLFALGILTLPIPIIGIPLLIWAIVTACSGEAEAKK